MICPLPSLFKACALIRGGRALAPRVYTSHGALCLHSTPGALYLHPPWRPMSTTSFPVATPLTPSPGHHFLQYLRRPVSTTTTPAPHVYNPPPWRPVSNPHGHPFLQPRPTGRPVSTPPAPLSTTRPPTRGAPCLKPH